MSSKIIRDLNDTLRSSFAGGEIYMTASVAALADGRRESVLEAARTFCDFDRDNDPHGEHDMAFFEVAGARYFFKIDYYDLEKTYGSENPADPAVTCRVLTIGAAADY